MRDLSITPWKTNMVGRCNFLLNGWKSILGANFFRRAHYMLQLISKIIEIPKSAMIQVGLLDAPTGGLKHDLCSVCSHRFWEDFAIEEHGLQLGGPTISKKMMTMMMIIIIIMITIIITIMIIIIIVLIIIITSSSSS